VLYPNGNRKEIWPDGKGTQVVYYNGDIKQKLADGSVIYTYADSGTKHTTKPDGTDILEFSRFVVLLELFPRVVVTWDFVFPLLVDRLKLLIQMAVLRWNIPEEHRR
jgi:hypothetical protein